MDTVDDIDEDEAFISELMALHPNDEDIIVEDIEAIEYPPPSIDDVSIIDQETINSVNADENDDNNNVDDGRDGVRN
jgi:hypothetical protein